MLISIFQGPKFKRAWQAQFLSNTLVILENDASFIDLQMILVPFFHISIILDRTGLRSSSEKSSNLKRVWQAQISSNTLVTLRKYVFFENNQMILVSF